MDAYINLRGANWRVSLRTLSGRRGVAIHGLTFGLEFLSTSQASLAGTQALIQGHLFVGPESGGMSYAGRLESGSAVAFGAGPVTTVDLETDLTAAQLKAIEQMRGEGGVTLTMNVFGALLGGGDVESFFGQLVYRPDAAMWLWALEQSGYGKRVVTRVPDAIE